MDRHSVRAWGRCAALALARDSCARDSGCRQSGDPGPGLARNRGTAGLGHSPVYGTLLLAMGASPLRSSVGDSMTVLDRHELVVRAALQNRLAFISALCRTACFVVAWPGFVDFRCAVAFGGAMFVYLIRGCAAKTAYDDADVLANRSHR